MSSGLIGDPRVHYALKRGLRGNVREFTRILDSLWRYSSHHVIKYVCYALVLQYVMNNVMDLGRECRACGGVCCKSGGLIPVYEFDLKELEKRLGSKTYDVLRLVDNNYYLERPCVFQEGWKCRIHDIKPYACLSYPFATEDEQLRYMEAYDGSGVPDVYAPSSCRAALKVKEHVYEEIDGFMDRYNRIPSPKELLHIILHGGLK